MYFGCLKKNEKTTIIVQKQFVPEGKCRRGCPKITWQCTVVIHKGQSGTHRVPLHNKTGQRKNQITVIQVAKDKILLLSHMLVDVISDEDVFI